MVKPGKENKQTNKKKPPKSFTYRQVVVVFRSSEWPVMYWGQLKHTESFRSCTKLCLILAYLTNVTCLGKL